MEGFILSLTSGLFGSVITLLGQKILNQLYEKKERRRRIFFTLMATRNYRTSNPHVEALNSIDIEYHSCKTEKGKNVIKDWKQYRLTLGNQNLLTESGYLESNKRFFILLHTMSVFLGYDFRPDEIETGAYLPIGHVEDDITLRTINQNMNKFFKSEITIPIRIENN